MSDLAEFLLARIAEDEDKARRTRFGATDRPWVLTLPPQVRALNGEFPPDHLRVTGRRMLAECEAKRDLVEGLDGSALFAPRNPTLPTLASEWLQILAVPYAGHPDYRDEWRP